MAEYMSQIGIEGLKGIPNSTATEDFAILAEEIPTTYMLLTAIFMDERGDYPLHHPKAQFDENVCVIGAACFTYCANGLKIIIKLIGIKSSNNVTIEITSTVWYDYCKERC